MKIRNNNTHNSSMYRGTGYRNIRSSNSWQQQHQHQYQHKRPAHDYPSSHSQNFAYLYRYYDSKYSYRNIKRRRFVRPPSPKEGSEEFTNLKIKEASASIMRKLFDPEEEPSSKKGISKVDDIPSIVTENNANQIRSINSNLPSINETNKTTLTAKNIREKIINHITNLKHGRMKNFINTNNRDYLDNALNKIQKQQRLEISRVIRDMSLLPNHNNIETNSQDHFTSIVPDLGIKIEELPHDVIEELKHTLNLDLECLNEEISNGLVKGGLSFADSEAAAEQANSDKQPENVIEEPKKITPKITFQKPVGDQQIDEQTPPIENVANYEIGSEPASEIFDLTIIKEERLEPPEDINEQTNNNENYDNNSIKETNNNENPDQFMSNFINLELEIENAISNDLSANNSLSLINMLKKADIIDTCIQRLTEYRRLLTKTVLNMHNTSEIPSAKHDEPNRTHLESKVEVKIEPAEEAILTFNNIKEKVTVMKQFANDLVLATETGFIIIISLKTGAILHSAKVLESPITALTEGYRFNGENFIYLGGFNDALQIYDYRNKITSKLVYIGGKARCMEWKWNYVFVGCEKGILVKFSCLREAVEETFRDGNTSSKEDILSLKAAQEGARKILITADRNGVIYTRDAFTLLLLRTFSSIGSNPIYSIILNEGHLYCATAKDNILVYSFHQGNLVDKIIEPNIKTATCLQLSRNLLLAGYSDGFIYLYDLKTKKLLKRLKGPGGPIRNIQVLSKQVVVTTLTGNLESVLLPENLIA